MQENEIDMDAMRLMGAADFVEIGIPKGPAVKIAYCLQAGRPPPGAALSSEITARKFLTALGLSKVRYPITVNTALTALACIMCCRSATEHTQYCTHCTHSQ
jgi:hypothetical protein